MTRDEIIQRGESAKQLLTNATAAAAWTALQDKCAESWRTSGPDQHILRDDAYRLVRCIELVKIQLQSWADEAVTEIHNGDAKITRLRDSANV